MATFLSLPNEMKFQIIETVAPDDIVNFALCCKLVHSLAIKTLRQHKAGKKRYHFLDFSVVGARVNRDILQPYHQVLDMVESSRLRLYCKRLEIFNCRLSDEERQSILIQRGALKEIAEVCDKIFDGFISPYIDEEEMKPWRKRVTDGSISELTCLLLTLLPNVRSMTVLDPMLWGRASADIVNEISRRNQEISSSIHDRLSLTKLSQMEIRYDASMPGTSGNTGLIEAFMGLPSMRSIVAGWLGPENKFNRWFHPWYQSNVKEIYILRSTLGVKPIARLLSHVGSLERFGYDHRKFIYRTQRMVLEDAEEDYSPDALINVLFQRARKTLKYLEYTTEAEDSLGDNRTRYIGTLRRFEVLRSLRLSRVLFIENGSMQRLVDELPSSLVELELDCRPRISLEEANCLLDGMLERKQERLPNLELIVFLHRTMPLDEDTILACQGIGLTLDWTVSGVDRGHKTGRSVRWIFTGGTD